jgi:hypothetical protein
VIPPRAGAFQDRAERVRLRQVVAGGGTAVLTQADDATALTQADGTAVLTQADGAAVLAQTNSAASAREPARGQVLSGMGGVGKTQLAADHARSALTGGELDLLVWVTAADRTSLVAGLGRAGIEMAGAQPDELQAAAEAFTAWLEPKAGQAVCRWLVVLDDVSDPADLEGLWPPASPYGRTLITTRRRDAAFTHDGRTRIDVGLFTEAEAVSYLAAVLAGHDRTEPVGQLAALAQDLGRLPLALSQAAAFMADADMNAVDYRTMLADRTGSLAEASPQPLPPGHTRAMAAAWDLSIGRAGRMRPAGLAPLLLQLAAFLDPNGISTTVLTSPPALAHLTEERAGTVGAPPPHDPASAEAVPAEAAAAEVTVEEVAAGLRVLHRLNLIDHTPKDAHRQVRVHALIQRAVRDALTSQQHDRTARTAADALLAAWPDIERDTVLAQTLRAGVAALTVHAETALHRPGVHPLLFRAGRSVGESGQAAAAITHYRQMAATVTRHLGPDHPDTLTARDSLARWRGEAGDAAGAAAACTDLLDDMLRVLGPDHIDTLTTRDNLARWQGRAGDAAGAAASFADLLVDRLRLLGPDHIDTLTTRHDLAYWQGASGDAAGAAAACTDLLDDMLRVLGPDHIDTLTTRNNLARLRGEAGDTAGAVTATADLLTDRQRVLGPDHPHTLTARQDLAYWRGESGDASGAVAAFADLLDDMLRVLGPDHINTLTTRSNLAYWQGEGGDAARAAASFADLLDDMLRVLGPDHPYTLIVRKNLAKWRQLSGEGPGLDD